MPCSRTGHLGQDECKQDITLLRDLAREAVEMALELGETAEDAALALCGSAGGLVTLEQARAAVEEVA